MNVEYGGSKYSLSFDNWKLHEYGEAIGVKTLEDTFHTLTEFAQVAEGQSMTLSQSKNLATLCSLVIDSEITVREALNLIYEYPGLITDCLSVVLDSLPKNRGEGVDKKKAELLRSMTS